MIIIGVNNSHTHTGKQLKDGSCAIIKDGRIIGALSEERITRKKHAGGYLAAFHHLLKSFNISCNEIDLIVSSTCCENEKYALNGLAPLISRYPCIETDTCNHHLSHALSSYHTSSFKNSIIIVMDAGGNTFDCNNNEEWWKSYREQHSYYTGINGKVRLIGRDFSKPEAAGIGEIYRAFTHYAGWPSSTLTGNLMALAGCTTNTPRIQNKQLIRDDNNELYIDIPCLPGSPKEFAHSILTSHNIQRINTINTTEPSQEAIAVAKWVQSEIEESLLQLIDRLVDKTGIKNISFAGGVAYNCKALGKLLKTSKAENFYIFPAAGDHGQALGNAIYGYSKKTKSFPHYSFTPFLGPSYPTNYTYIKNLIAKLQLTFSISNSLDITNDTADILSANETVGWFQDRSEYGPRALGNRSILASPGAPDIKTRLNKIKNRPHYMPLAPAILKDEADRYFESGGNEFMSIAVEGKKTTAPWIESITHQDYTARVQLVEEKNNKLLHNVLTDFFKKTDIPVLLNTSFNGGGQPIVETISDALEAFVHLNIDCLIIGNNVIRKQQDAKVLINFNYLNKRTTIIDIRNVFEIVKEKTKTRNRFLLYCEYVNWVKEKRKCTTIRYVKDFIDLPSAAFLPLLSTDDYGTEYANFIGKAVISDITIKHFGHLNEKDAQNDGFSSLKELREALQNIYGKIDNMELVTIYKFCLADVASDINLKL